MVLRANSLGIAQQLAIKGRPANVANFSVLASGRNVEWAVVDELYKTKPPDVIVVGVNGAFYPFGQQSKLYENWEHLNHAGTLIGSDRVTDAIVAMRASKQDRSLLK